MILKVALIAAILISLDFKSACQKNTIAINIPDTVFSRVNNGQLQIAGTHIFMTKPSGFQFNFAANRLEKNDSTYIKIVETPSANYTDKYNTFIGVIKMENAGGFKTYYQKDFIFKKQKAIILYGLDRIKTTEQIILLFGNDTGSTMILSRFSVGDQKSKNEILKSLISAYKVDSSNLNISAIQNFSVDMLDTKFKYNGTTLQLFFYTINGLGDPAGNLGEDFITIGTMPALADDNLVKEKLHSMIESFRKLGMTVDNYNENKIVVNKLDAHEIIINGKLKDKTNVIYLVMLTDNKVAILFQGVAYNNREIYLEQFKKIAKTLKLK